MNTYVLIIMFTHYDVGGVTTQEFNTLERCQSAKKWAQGHYVPSERDIYAHNKGVKAECFKK